MNKELVIKFFTNQELVNEIEKRMFNKPDLSALISLFYLTGKIINEKPDLYSAMIEEIKKQARDKEIE